MKLVRPVVLALVGCFMAGNAMAQEPTASDEVFYVRGVTCAEGRAGDPAETGYEMVYLYGYASGEAGNDLQTTTEIQAVIKAAEATCKVSAGRRALDVFVEAIGAYEGDK